MGAISWCSSLRILGEISSGPEALFGESPCSNLSTPWGARWPSGLAWAGDRTVSRPGSNPATVTSLRNFGNSVYPALPVSFGGDTKSRRSLLSGVYARGSKRSHQSALECVTVVDSTTHSKLPDLQSAIMRRKTLPCTCIGRRRRRRRYINNLHLWCINTCSSLFGKLF